MFYFYTSPRATWLELGDHINTYRKEGKKTQKRRKIHILGTGRNGTEIWPGEKEDKRKSSLRQIAYRDKERTNKTGKPFFCLKQERKKDHP